MDFLSKKITSFWETYIDPELSLEHEQAECSVPGSHAKSQSRPGTYPNQNKKTSKSKQNTPKIYEVYSTPSGGSTFTTVSANPLKEVVNRSSSNTLNHVWINPSVKRQESVIEIPMIRKKANEWANTNFDSKVAQKKLNNSSKYNQASNNNDAQLITKYLNVPEVKTTDEPDSNNWDAFGNVYQLSKKKTTAYRRPYIIEELKRPLFVSGRNKNGSDKYRESKYFEKVTHFGSEDTSSLKEVSRRLRKNETETEGPRVPIEKESIPTLTNTNEDITVSELPSPSEVWVQAVQEQQLKNKGSPRRPPTRGKQFVREKSEELNNEEFYPVQKSSRRDRPKTYRPKIAASSNKGQYDNTILKISNLPPGTTHSEFQRLFPEAAVTKPLEEDDLTSYDLLCYGYAIFSTASKAKEARLRSEGRSFKGHHLVIEYRTHQ